MNLFELYYLPYSTKYNFFEKPEIRKINFPKQHQEQPTIFIQYEFNSSKWR